MGGLLPRVIYKILTCPFTNQHLWILRQPLDHTHTACWPWVGWCRIALRLQVKGILLTHRGRRWEVGVGRTVLFLALAALAASAFNDPGVDLLFSAIDSEHTWVWGV